MDTYMEMQRDRADKAVLDRQLSKRDMKDIDADNDGMMSEVEYLQAMLIKLERCEKEEIVRVRERFKELDKDGSGFVDMKEVMGN